MAGTDVSAQWIRFDDVEIDVAGHRLLVRGDEVPLERKAFAVLVLLAGSPGRVFGRDEILDAVWQHRHVTPGVLNRVVTLLRQALGDIGESHRYLRTVHGVGYRFDAAVSDPAERGPAGVPAMAVTDASSVPAAETGTPRTPPMAPRRLLPLAVVALVVAVVAAAGALWWHRSMPPAKATSPVLVVLPLRAVGTEHDQAVLADGLSEELITRLARIGGLSLISTESASLARSQGLDRNQLAARLHVTHALEGSLRQSGNRLRIDLRLVEVPSGRTLWTSDYDRTIADVFAIESEIAQSVAATLALKLGLPASTPEADPEGFREYLGLRWRVRRFEIGTGAERDRFIAQLTAFAARYPGYARAHGLLALGLIARTFSAPPIAEAQVAQARREAGRALELDPDDIDALMATAWQACVDRDWERCLGGADHLAALAPADAQVRVLNTYELAKLGYLDRALAQAEIGVASDPLSYAAANFRAHTLDAMGRHEEARKAFDAMEGLPGVTPRSLALSRWFNAIWRHDFDAARRAAPLIHPVFRDSYVAVTEALADPSRWPPAIPLIEASEHASGRRNFLRLLEPNADIPADIAILEDVFRNESSSFMLLLWNPEMAALRRDPAFQEFLKRNRILDYWNAHGFPSQCHREGDQAICP